MLYTPDKVTIAELPAGEASIDRTLRYMAQFTKAAGRDYAIRRLALGIVAPFAQKDYLREAAALHAFVRDRIRYVKDPLDGELVQTPVATLGIGQGDCDDKATLLAALLRAAGHPARFVAVAVGDDPNLSHVYVETKIGPTWYAAETTEPWPFGAFARRITRRKVWNI